jgi:hypothetical protein
MISLPKRKNHCMGHVTTREIIHALERSLLDINRSGRADGL